MKANQIRTKQYKVKRDNIEEQDIKKKNIMWSRMKQWMTRQVKADFIYYVWLFFLLAVFGWLWEGFLCLFKDDMYVNRGFLTGPWLPIYGMGGVLLEILLHRWRDRPVLVFLSSMAVCTLLEYVSGWYLELTWGVKWWDYSTMPWNLHGRICFLSSVLFGLGGMLLVWVVSPLFYSLYRRIPVKVKIGLGLLLLGVFAADAAYSAMFPHEGMGVTFTARRNSCVSDMALLSGCLTGANPVWKTL